MYIYIYILCICICIYTDVYTMYIYIYMEVNAHIHAHIHIFQIYRGPHVLSRHGMPCTIRDSEVYTCVSYIYIYTYMYMLCTYIQMYMYIFRYSKTIERRMCFRSMAYHASSACFRVYRCVCHMCIYLYMSRLCIYICVHIHIFEENRETHALSQHGTPCLVC